MRLLTINSISIALLLSPAAAVAGAGTIQYRATATFSDGSSADRLYAVRLDADSDGDGIGDDAWLRVRCDNGAVAAAFEYDVKAPRDVATGQASGKRMHKPFTITKEWGRTGGVTGQKLGWDIKQGKDPAARKGTYDQKTNEKGRVIAVALPGTNAKVSMQDFHFVVVKAGAPNLCE